MKVRRVRRDLDHLNSWVLLVVTAGTVVTGLIVHLWDLHGFTWHTYLGYAMIVVVMVHLALNMRQLLACGGLRLRQGPRKASGSPPPKLVRPDKPPAGIGATSKAVLLSRRGLVGMALGGAGGYLLGQSVRPRPNLGQGTDRGLVYHSWSSDPGMVDAVGALANLGRQPPLYKSYDDAARVALPPVSMTSGLPTETAMARRHSVRAYAAPSMTAQELSRILLLTAGLNEGGRRHHPSSGALYPIETDTVLHNAARSAAIDTASSRPGTSGRTCTCLPRRSTWGLRGRRLPRSGDQRAAGYRWSGGGVGVPAQPRPRMRRSTLDSS